MKIAFLGDSITEGIPGVSYVKKIESTLPLCKVSNYGVGGDTIQSLFKRIIKYPELKNYDVIILFVGVNDLFGKISTPYKIIKALKRQRAAKSVEKFKESYSLTLEYLSSICNKIYVVTPLVIGENYNNKWNKELEKYNKSIINQLSSFPKVKLIDVYSVFKNYISKQKDQSDYIPVKPYDLVKDLRELKNDVDVDNRSRSRGLHLTLDGVHINSQGANLLSDAIKKELQTLL